jgi:hypothetical protein
MLRQITNNYLTLQWRLLQCNFCWIKKSGHDIQAVWLALAWHAWHNQLAIISQHNTTNWNCTENEGIEPISAIDWLLNAARRFMTGSSAPAGSPLKKVPSTWVVQSSTWEQKKSKCPKTDLAQAPLEQVSTVNMHPCVEHL